MVILRDLQWLRVNMMSFCFFAVVIAGIADYLQSKNRHSLVFGDDWVKKHKAAAS